ncbi:MAG: AI-2E family transporter [Hyphomicrobiales bacterium]
MTTPSHALATRSNLITYVVTTAGVIAALYYGQNLFRPLALGLLCSILLSASTEALQKLPTFGAHLKNWMAMALSVLIVLLGLLLVVQILSGQASDVTQAWPRYVARFEGLLTNLAHWLGEDIASQARIQFSKLDLSSSVPVIASKTGSILADIVMTGLYTAFILATQKSFVHKLPILFPKSQDHLNVKRVMATASKSIRKYILIKTIMSIITGLVSYGVLRFLNVDFAETWALLIFLLNYIPTVGSIIGVIFPAILALVQFDTFGPFLVIVILLTGAQFTIGNVIEPIFMGKVLNLSALAVLIALSLWGTMWGVAGMFMSVPITVVFMIFCAHIPAMQWIAILLSEDGRLDTETDTVISGEETA